MAWSDLYCHRFTLAALLTIGRGRQSCEEAADRAQPRYGRDLEPVVAVAVAGKGWILDASKHRAKRISWPVECGMTPGVLA